MDQTSWRQDQTLRSLPLITLYLTERCNSRCVSCDYWRHGRADMTPETIAQRLPELARLGTQTVLISGGEPLIHPQWIQIAETLRSAGLQLWLLTSGLSLLKHAAAASRLFDAITVSLDGTDRAMYAAIRGLDAFDTVCAGVRAAARHGLRPSIRVTVQRGNFAHLSRFVEIAQHCGARQISFLAADVSSRHAFGRDGAWAPQIALQAADLPLFAQALDELERTQAAAFDSGFIAESPLKLHRLWQYYAAILGNGPFPPTRCNAPEFSAVIEAGGRINPCFFIQGPDRTPGSVGLEQSLNAEAMVALRQEIRAGQRPECARCVCSMWRDPVSLPARPMLPAAAAPISETA